MSATLAPDRPASGEAHHTPGVYHWGVVVFPGTNCEYDTEHVLRNVLGQQVELVDRKSVV